MPEIDDKKYPSNSKAPKPEPEKPSKLVSKATIVKREKPFLIKLGDTLGPIGNYILWDILLPAAKSTISDIMHNSTDMMVWGEPRERRNVRRDRGRSYVSYDRYYERDRPTARERRESHDRNNHRFDDMVLDTRGDAEEILSRMVDMIDQYGVVKVADFYDMIGFEAEWSDHRWGWENLRRASVMKVREGYILDLPNPISLGD